MFVCHLVIFTSVERQVPTIHLFQILTFIHLSSGIKKLKRNVFAGKTSQRIANVGANRHEFIVNIRRRYSLVGEHAVGYMDYEN